MSDDRLFRFQGMQIWQRAADASSSLFKMAAAMDERRYHRFAEQLRAATLSITNNIAEGSGSNSDDDFAHFLNMARRSVFEVANMLMLFTREGYLKDSETSTVLQELFEQSRMIQTFRRTLKS